MSDAIASNPYSFFSQETRDGIEHIIDRIMNNVIKRRIEEEPWDYDDLRLTRPFDVALVPEIILKSSKFERSFVTSRGQIGWEQIARLIAEDHHGQAVNSYRVKGQMTESQMHHIQNILNSLESRERTPGWEDEFNEIIKIGNTGKSRLINSSVLSDLYVLNKQTDQHYYFEIKAPKPNSDQTKVSKEKMLKIKAMYPGDNHQVYFALPYNPYGTREAYNWSHPKRWFDMISSPVVKIGKEFWDLLAGEGAFEALIQVFEDIGAKYREIIKEKYLDL